MIKLSEVNRYYHKLKNTSTPKWLLLLAGFFALIWVLIRVIPKPSRFNYPCQKMAFPLAFFFLSWVGGIIASLTFSRIFKKGISKFIYTFALLILSTGLVTVMATGSDIIIRNENVELTLSQFQSSYDNPSNIFVVPETNGNDDGVDRLIDLMEAKGTHFYKTKTNENGLILKDDVIILKVNCQWNQRGGTNTDLVKSLIRKITEHPEGFSGEIIVADNGQAQYGSSGFGGSLDWDLNNSENKSQSIQDVVNGFSSFKVSTYLWDEITKKRVSEYQEGDKKDGYIVYDNEDKETGVVVSYPKFKSKYGTYISFKKGIWDETLEQYNSERLKVINLPVLKAHFIYGVTANIKHYMGVVSDKLTNGRSHSSVDEGGMGTVMAETRVPVLNITDAIWVNAQRGPSTPYSRATYLGIIAASTDPVALDYWVSKNLLIQAANSIGNNYGANNMDPDNTSKGSFGNWLRLSMDELKAAGYETTVQPDRMNVFIANN
ncbi:MAG: DUF362 domain-containing protein [Petrotogales bacterium]